MEELTHAAILTTIQEPLLLKAAEDDEHLREVEDAVVL